MCLMQDLRSRLVSDLQSILVEKPGQTKYQLFSALGLIGWSGITTSDINSVLYSYRQHFTRSTDTLPRWYNLSTSTPRAARPHKTNLLFYAGPEPRDWQREAFEAWKMAGRHGVVEAVTGTGKTAVGILAAADAAQRGLRSFILVPSRDLLDQWYEKLVNELPSLRIGRFGDGSTDELTDHNIIVGTVQSAYKYRMLPPSHRGLLVADEVHRYGADKFALALESGFEERLGLTATYEREDDGVERQWRPYLFPLSGNYALGNEVVANCSYARGLHDGILAHFKVHLIGVDFTSGEQSQYDELDARVKHLRSHLIRQHDCPERPYGEFMKAVSLLSEGGHGDFKGTNRARQYLAAFSKRRSLLADCNRKMDALVALGKVLAGAERAIVFTETVSAAIVAARKLRELDIAAEAYTSELVRDTRKQLLSSFRSGSTTVLAAPKVLDEGIDVPEADVGVIVAASRSRRQMIQRMGRIIRPKSDNRQATFIVIYVRNTSEDPELGAHDAFLTEMVDNADEINRFSFSGRDAIPTI